MKSQLLATFTTKDNLDETIEKIVDAYTIVFNKESIKLDYKVKTKPFIDNFFIDDFIKSFSRASSDKDSINVLDSSFFTCSLSS